MTDAFVFLREFVRDPNRIGAVAPSGKQLAARMCESADLADDHVIVELGAGTGPFTRAIRERHPHAPLLALEPKEDLAALLREELPDVEVVEAFAQELPRLCAEWGHPVVDRVVSGLPWTLWPPEVQRAALDAVVEVLSPDGRFVTFNYLGAHLMPKAQALRGELAERFGRVEMSSTAWLNVPPAFVYICSEPKKG
ncbi:MAG: methyltransferase domain-containing protein [Deltaproteobacteria bacterium]|nr:MAG: methyltransferase domain-containing protein [Deltaproteobacteria bacterium]